MVETRSRAALNADKSAVCVDLNSLTSKPKQALNHASMREREPAAVCSTEVKEEVPSVSSGASNKRKRARACDGKSSCHTPATKSEPPTVSTEPGSASKRARVAPGAFQRPTEEATEGRVSSDSRAARNAKILLEASSRLVWSRVEEVEGFKASIVELGRAIHQVEAMRQRIEASVDRDLQSATQVAAVYMPGAQRSGYGEPFAKFFYALIGHLIPN